MAEENIQQSIEEAEEARKKSLRKARRFATGLLLLMVVFLIISKIGESRYGLSWLEYVHAFAEAAVVGALADWFAVTALFRYPLGVRIPHTAIIPNKKDSIGRGIGKFVEGNFLNPDSLSKRIRNMDIASKAEEWLAEPDNAMAIAERLTQFLPELIEGLDDKNVQEFIRTNINSTLQKTDLSDVGGQVLKVLVENDKDNELFDEIIKLLQQLLQENKPALKEAIKEESPVLLKGIMSRQVFDRIVVKVNRRFTEIAKDENHPVRKQYQREIDLFIHRLQNDPEYKQRSEELKHELLNNPRVQAYFRNLGNDLKQMILEDARHNQSKIKQRIFRSIYGLSNGLLKEKEVRDRLNNWVYEAATNLIVENSSAISTMISDTIRKWDRETMVTKLETQVGKDLQYIRINGTLVGGAVGLTLHILAQFIKII